MCRGRTFVDPGRTIGDPIRRDARPDIRASQAERDETVERLRDHAGEGRLDVDELEQRVERALDAQTRGDLDVLLADLPRSRRPAPVRVIARGAWAAALAPLLAGIAVLALAPAALAWVGWTMLGWWFFAGLPSAGAGFAWCGHAKRRRRRAAAV